MTSNQLRTKHVRLIRDSFSDICRQLYLFSCTFPYLYLVLRNNHAEGYALLCFNFISRVLLLEDLEPLQSCTASVADHNNMCGLLEHHSNGNLSENT